MHTGDAPEWGGELVTRPHVTGIINGNHLRSPIHSTDNCRRCAVRVDAKDDTMTRYASLNDLRKAASPDVAELNETTLNGKAGGDMVVTGITAIKRHKYGAEKTEVDGITFDSKKESYEYRKLKMLERIGAISDLVLQPAYMLQEEFWCNGKRIRAIEYIADFAYTQDGRRIAVDVKGMRTPVYLLKRKMFLKRYPEITLIER